jgi:hypothetical protein
VVAWRVVILLHRLAIDILTLSFFFEMGHPSLCIKEMHTSLLYFIYSTQTGKKALQRTYKLKPLQTQVSKHHQTSTMLEK